MQWNYITVLYEINKLKYKLKKNFYKELTAIYIYWMRKYRNNI